MRHPEDLIGDATRAFYELWVVEARKADPAVADRLPSFEDLTPEQLLDWIAAYAATVEVSHRMAKASVGVLTTRVEG